MARAKKKEADDDAVEVVVSDEEASKIRGRLEGRDYIATPTLERFHASRAFVRGVRGPVGGGKSTACCQEIIRRAREQKPGQDGIRRTRWAIVRNTYGELKDTTVKTWLEWFPEEWFGRFNRQQGEMRHHIQMEGLDCEVLFRALDRPDDIRKVLSLELTGAWINEAREVPKQIIDALGDRVGRYPSMRDGGPVWSGIIMDTNSPPKSHWWFEAAEKSLPEGWKFFAQPPALVQRDGKWALNKAAENLANLEGANDNPPNLGRYYLQRYPGKREDYIKVYYGNQYGFVQEGKPVFPEYNDTVHGAKDDIAFVAGEPVFIGIGLSLASAALFGQRRKNGQWVWLDELLADQGAIAFAEQLKARMASEYPGGTVFRIFTQKPDNHDDADAEAIQILRGRGVNAQPCRVNDAVLRREAVAGVLSRLIHGDPALLISPKCEMTREAMNGGYCYPKLQVAEERYGDEPAKNRYAPLGDAAQVMLVGGGEAAFVFKTGQARKLKYPALGIV